MVYREFLWPGVRFSVWPFNSFQLLYFKSTTHVHLFWAIFWSFLSFLTFYSNWVSMTSCFVQISYGCFYLYSSSSVEAGSSSESTVQLLCIVFLPWKHRATPICVILCIHLYEPEMPLWDYDPGIINSDSELQIHVSIVWPLVPWIPFPGQSSEPPCDKNDYGIMNMSERMLYTEYTNLHCSHYSFCDTREMYLGRHIDGNNQHKTKFRLHRSHFRLLQCR